MSKLVIVVVLLTLVVGGVALWRLREPSKPHPHARELAGLAACLVAWHRAGLEELFQDNPDDREALAERLTQLGYFVRGAGVDDPFVTEVMRAPLGELDGALFMNAHWSLDTAAGIAWALGLVETLTAADERADVDALYGLLPFDGRDLPDLGRAALRDPAELAAKLEALDRQLAEMEVDPSSREASFARSRLIERTRGLRWVLGDARWVERDMVEPDGGAGASP